VSQPVSRTRRRPGGSLPVSGEGSGPADVPGRLSVSVLSIALTSASRRSSDDPSNATRSVAPDAANGCGRGLPRTAETGVGTSADSSAQSAS
jgi:hypothetical protein